MCPLTADGPALLKVSEIVGSKRYATDGTYAYCAQLHDESADLWHGYPVSWKEVPENLRRSWIADGLVRKRVVNRDGDFR